MVKQAVAVGAVSLMLVLPGGVDACSCLLNPPRLEETFGKAQLVFLGELVAAIPHLKDRCGDETLTFLPSKIWKGPPTGPVVVTNRSVGRRPDGRLPGFYERACIVGCPVRVTERREYIVFAFGPDARLQYCHAPVETSHDVAEYMRKLDEIVDRSHAGGPANDELQRTSDGKLPARR